MAGPSQEVLECERAFVGEVPVLVGLWVWKVSLEQVLCHLIKIFNSNHTLA